jgi:hypothetical protein
LPILQRKYRSEKLGQISLGAGAQYFQDGIVKFGGNLVWVKSIGGIMIHLYQY